MRADTSSYVIGYSSLVAVSELDVPRAATVIAGLARLATAGRLRTVAFVWKLISDAQLRAALDPCQRAFVVRELELVAEIRMVLGQCGTVLLGDDPVNEDPEPWLVALAIRDGSSIISEASDLSRLPDACTQLNIRLDALPYLLNAENL